ncbi:hypothetical protein ACFQZC_07845 [Streptacidiphilus monticola]
MSSAHELAREQRHLDLLHRQVDLRRAQADAELRGTLRQSSPTPQARVERGVTAQRLSTQIARYDAAEHGLCFGRLDLADGTRRYLGRIGLPAEDREGEPLLVDWRAPPPGRSTPPLRARRSRCGSGGTCTPGAAGWSASTTNCWTASPAPPATSN